MYREPSTLPHAEDTYPEVIDLHQGTRNRYTPAEEAYQYMHRNSPGRGEPSFELAEMLEKVWGKHWGVSNDVGKMRSVLVSRPGSERDVMMARIPLSC